MTMFFHATSAGSLFGNGLCSCSSRRWRPCTRNSNTSKRRFPASTTRYPIQFPLGHSDTETMLHFAGRLGIMGIGVPTERRESRMRPGRSLWVPTSRQNRPRWLVVVVVVRGYSLGIGSVGSKAVVWVKKTLSTWEVNSESSRRLSLEGGDGVGV